MQTAKKQKKNVTADFIRLYMPAVKNYLRFDIMHKAYKWDNFSLAHVIKMVLLLHSPCKSFEQLLEKDPDSIMDVFTENVIHAQTPHVQQQH
jgi:hypothetical protein